MKTKTEGLTLKGVVTYRLFGPDGKLKDIREKVMNLTTLVGFDAVCKQMGDWGSQPAGFKWCAVGSGEVAAHEDDEALGTEITRVAGTFSKVSAKVWKMVTTFGTGVGTGAITESGLLNAASDGLLLCRQVFSVINKGADDTLEVTWQYTLS